VADTTPSFLGRGWRFPVKPDAQGRLNYVGGDEEIRESLWIILTTAPGERQMLEQFGCDVHDLVFGANTAALRGLVEQNVRSTLTLWEPRIDVLDVRAESPADQRNILTIHIDYRIRANNAIYNLVYPFFLNEGVS
jgi:phage baseplate assembly protein W